jgi:3-methyladenine DNA glycosylase AlkD
MLKDLLKEVEALADKERAKISQWFFKTGEGEYGYGDHFIGIVVPVQRQIARKHADLSLLEVKSLLKSKIHEHRFIGLEILVIKFEKGSAAEKEKVAKFYLQNTKQVNNWDLVDTSAPYILGEYLLDKPKAILYKLAKSKNIWERRIAIVSTAGFIKNNQFTDTVKISEILLEDKHDLIHKAAGWMLREMGKKDEKALVKFLDKNASRMPRTMLRYAIEKFPERERKKYLSIKQKIYGYRTRD